MRNIQKKSLNEIELLGLKISYTIIYSRRRSIMIKIEPGKQLEVLAPLNAPLKAIRSFLEDKSEWIVKTLEKQKYYISLKAPVKFEIGEKISYLGKAYNLKFKKDIISNITISSDDFIVLSPHPALSAEKARSMVTKWLKENARTVFNESLEHCLKLTKAIGINSAKPVKIRKMDKRWGTCTSDNQIILNSSLIFVDRKYIDYIMLHELCHFREKNHSNKYYELLETVCPDYKKLRKQLNYHLIENFL